MAKFSDALDRKMEEIKRPPHLPAGHYIWQVSKYPEFDEFESQRNGQSYERLTFQVSCVQPTDDVDQDELAAYGNVVNTPMRKTFLFGDSDVDAASFARSQFNLKQFLTNLGLDTSEDGGLTLQEALAASVGCQFIGEITLRPDPKDPEIIYAEIGRTTAV